MEVRASSVIAASPLCAMPMAPRPLMAPIPALVPAPAAPVASIALTHTPAAAQPTQVPMSPSAAPSRPVVIAAPAAAPVPQAGTPAFGAASSSPAPGPTPIAAAAAAPTPVRPPTTLPLLDDLLSLDSDTGSSTLLLQRLPAYVTAELLGSVFCQFGRLRVHLVLLVRHGLTAVLQYTSVEAATTALQSMRGRSFEIEVRRGTPDAFTATVERWSIAELVFARTPLVPVVPPPTQVKLLGYGQASAGARAPGAPLTIRGDRSLFSFN